MHLLASLRRLGLLLMHLHGHGLLHWNGLHLHWLHLQWLHLHWLRLHWLKLLLHELRWLEPLLPWLQPLLNWMQPWLHCWLRRTHGNRLALCLYDLCLGLKIPKLQKLLLIDSDILPRQSLHPLFMIDAPAAKPKPAHGTVKQLNIADFW